MRRVGTALVEHIRRMDAPAKFVIVEAAPAELAQAIAEGWDDQDDLLPQLAIAAANTQAFGKFALVGTSAAALRHRDPRGLCLVVCEGHELAERQSLRSFWPVSPGDLLQSKSRLLLLSRAVTRVREDGPMAAIRDALVTINAGERPSAIKVGSFLDAVAAGEDPMQALPIVGAFRDPDVALADVRGDRVIENLRLAASSRRDDVVRPGSFGDIRTRATRILSRRSGANGGALAATFMELLESGSDDILRFVSYDEAKEILTSGSKQLSAQVRQAIADHRRTLLASDRERADSIPWEEYRASTDALDRAADRKTAARDLLEFDAAEREAVFLPDTRRKLQTLLRDRAITATPGSALEAGLARAIRSLGAMPTRIVVVDPHPASPPNSQTAAREWLSLAAARLRLAPVLRTIEGITGCEIDGVLTVEPFAGLTVEEREGLFAEAGLQSGGLPALRLRLHSEGGRVELLWAPDIDDVAMLRCLMIFAEGHGLSLLSIRPPDAFSTCVADLEPVPAPAALYDVAVAFGRLCQDLLHDGLRAERLRVWAETWRENINSARGFRSPRTAEAAALAGCIRNAAESTIGMTPFAPLKAEWLADCVDASTALVTDAIEVVRSGQEEHQAARSAFETCADAVSNATATHCPPFLRLSTLDQPLLPSTESRIWSVFGGSPRVSRLDRHAAGATETALLKLLRLQPEAAGHLRSIAFGPGAADLLLEQAIKLAGRRVYGVAVERVEVFVVGNDNLPSAETLAAVDEFISKAESRATIELRYLDSLQTAHAELSVGGAAVHFALVTGLTAGGNQPTVANVELDPPASGTDSLFSPRVWQRPDTENRVLLMPPGPSETVLTWLRLGQAIDDRWPRASGPLSVPEMRTGVAGAADALRLLHEMALWVATLDRYASRESLERALEGEVAILHQERRLGSESPIGLVVSQKSGGPVDRAIGRSLRQARIVADEGEAVSIGAQLREVAAQGYGILALEAATSGTGINELVGHVVGFSLLGTTSTPWPLPPGCRVILVNLDEHANWFLGGKRADLLALAIDTEEGGVHGAVIEVKARRSDANQASTEALDQLRKSLLASAPAAYPRPDQMAARVWLNRIADAAYGVARESRIRLTDEELDALEAFRMGGATLEWAGLALVFGPEADDSRRVYRQEVENDWVPISVHEIRLTEDRLRAAVATDLRELYTAETQATPLSGGRHRRRPEAGVPRPVRDDDEALEPSSDSRPSLEPDNTPAVPSEPLAPPSTQTAPAQVFIPPVLGWDQVTGEPVHWRAAGENALSNGHVQIWGSSGAGKTQFVKLLLAQLAIGNGANFGVADFKNDYGPTPPEDFPSSVGAEFLDLWARPGAPYNPLGLASDDRAALDSRIIEFRDCVEQAMSSFQRVGSRQKQAIARALEASYAEARGEGRWPTMLDLNRAVGDDIMHILGDLTRYEIFSDGPPLDVVVDRNVVFGLSRIPGNGQTTVLAAAFILSVIGLAMQDRPPVANKVNYAMVVDEAHRVAQFKALHLMLREGRSKGLAVVLATQAPADFPEVVDNNAQTRICFRLSDAVIAGQAARKLDPSDATLPDRIRTLASGEAFVSFEGSPPRLLSMVQHYRDRTLMESGRLAERRGS